MKPPQDHQEMFDQLVELEGARRRLQERIPIWS